MLQRIPLAYSIYSYRSLPLMRLRLSCVNPEKYKPSPRHFLLFRTTRSSRRNISATFAPKSIHKRARERTVRFTQKRKNVGEKSTWLSFARRRGSAGKGTEIPSFFSPCSTPLLLSWTPAGGVIRTQTITERRKIKWDRIMCTREKEPEGSRSLAHGSYSCRCRFVQKCFVSRIHARTRPRLSICVFLFTRKRGTRGLSASVVVTDFTESRGTTERASTRL